ncbi:hypothetical protein ACWCYZ_14795 [Streptomyces virginiae]
MARTATRTVRETLESVSTADLLADVLSLAQDTRPGAMDVVRLAEAAAVLQGRCGRPAHGRRFNPDNAADLLADRVMQAGGILALSADVVRHSLVPTLREDVRTWEQDPQGGHTVRTHMEVLTGLGLGVFPGPALPAGAIRTVVYERDLPLGQLLAALAAGEDVGGLVEDITAAAL